MTPGEAMLMDYIVAIITQSDSNFTLLFYFETRARTTYNMAVSEPPVILRGGIPRNLKLVLESGAFDAGDLRRHGWGPAVRSIAEGSDVAVDRDGNFKKQKSSREFLPLIKSI